MRQVATIGVAVFAFCVALTVVGSRLRDDRDWGTTAVRLLTGTILLAAYAYGVLHLTILGRSAGESRTARLELFWSHRESLAWAGGEVGVTDAGLLAEILLNVILFVPLGALLPYLFSSLVSRGRALRGLAVTCLVACGCSLAIELAQWWFRLGLFEFDDVFDNTLGAAMGHAVYWLVWWAVRSSGVA